MTAPISIDVALLRATLPDLVLRPGMSVVARVASRGAGARAALVLANTLIGATVPPEVRAGDTLRLTVAETSPERIVLRMDGQQPPVAVPAPPPPPAPMDAARVRAEREPRPGDGREAVTLEYDAPALGTLAFRIELGPEGITVLAAAPAASAGLAAAAADDLRAGLTASTGRPAAVRVLARREPVDRYA